MLLLNNSKRKKLLIGTAMTVFVSLVIFVGVLPNVFADTSFYLANAAVELDGTNNGEVTISLNTAEADSIFGSYPSICPVSASVPPLYIFSARCPPAPVPDAPADR